MERVRVGLVGCGTIATRAYLPEIARMPRAGLVAVCDVQTRLVAVAQATRAARLELAALVRAQHRGGPRAGTQIVPSNRRDCHASGPGDVRAR